VTTGFISDGSFLYVVRATSVDKIGKAGGIFTDGASHL